uniref:Uncharacterized protein n=1 Tax=Anopheles culicifacies TaxID=139723 RepID=A0A182MQM6_9DIPT
MKNESVIILPRDTFQYSIIKHYRCGRPKRINCEFRVDGDRMKHISPSSCGPFPSETVFPNRHRNYTAEIALLEDIINDRVSSCEGADFNKLLILIGDPEGKVLASELKRYVIEQLSTLLPKVNWDETVENVYLSQDRIVFDVKTVLLKLKILHTIRGTVAAKFIVDFERYNNYDNDDDYDEYGAYTERTV